MLSDKEAAAIIRSRIALCYEPVSSQSGSSYNAGVRAALHQVAIYLGAESIQDEIFNIIQQPAPDSVQGWEELKAKKRK